MTQKDHTVSNDKSKENLKKIRKEYTKFYEKAIAVVSLLVSLAFS